MGMAPSVQRGDLDLGSPRRTVQAVPARGLLPEGCVQAEIHPKLRSALLTALPVGLHPLRGCKPHKDNSVGRWHPTQNLSFLRAKSAPVDEPLPLPSLLAAAPLYPPKPQSIERQYFLIFLYSHWRGLGAFMSYFQDFDLPYCFQKSERELRARLQFALPEVPVFIFGLHFLILCPEGCSFPSSVAAVMFLLVFHPFFNIKIAIVHFIWY